MLRLVTVITLLIFAHAAAAQNNRPSIQPPPFAGGSAVPPTVPPTDLPSGIRNYCIYASLIFLIGYPVCRGKASAIFPPRAPETASNQGGSWTTRPVAPKLAA